MDSFTVLVTGSAGFIGSKVVEMLCADSNTKVVGIDDLNHYYDPELKKHRLANLACLSNFEFQEMCVEDRNGLARLFRQNAFDSVINLAARAGVRYSMENPHVYASTNSLGSLNLLEEMRETNVKKYVLASTSSLYAGQEMPFSESLAVNTPISPYAASKKSAELMAYSFRHLYDIDVSVVRYFTVYGPAGRPDMSYFRFIRQIYNEQPITVFGDGEQSRDFTFVDDVARGTIAATKPVGYEIINLGRGGVPISINSIIAKLEILLEKTARVEYKPAHQADVSATRADISKARQLLGWEPEVDIDSGLKLCVDWFVKNLPWSNRIDMEIAPKSCGPKSTRSH